MVFVPRPERHPVDGILDVSRDLVLRDGARSVTVDRIVAASGAPKGSVYYRFSTVDDLLATMWIRAVRRSQARFLEPLSAGGDPVEAAVAAGLAVHDFAWQEPADARLLAALRREDLVGEVTDPALAVALQEVNDPLRAALSALARRLYGRATRDTVERTTCAVVDLPQGAIRRHLVAGVAVPGGVRSQLTAAIRAALPNRPVPPARIRKERSNV
jgi:AcrR family transcriptional regulator